MFSIAHTIRINGGWRIKKAYMQYHIKHNSNNNNKKSKKKSIECLVVFFHLVGFVGMMPKQIYLVYDELKPF